MATVLLERHGLTELTGPVLAGWTSGVNLDDRGRAQAEELARRLSPVPLAAVVASPLARCQQTAAALVAGRADPPLTTDERLGECRYGDWNGRSLEQLSSDKLWQVVQAHPSGATFPGEGGEALRDTQHRAVSAIRDWNARLGEDATYAVCSHGDVLKAVIADALGMHLDMFQRIHVEPGSLSVVNYTRLRPFLLRLNDTGGGVTDLVPKPPAKTRRRGWRRLQAWPLRKRAGRADDSASDAPVGGGA